MDDLNDINGFHVKPEDAFHALDTAKSGPGRGRQRRRRHRHDLQRIQRRNREPRLACSMPNTAATPSACLVQCNYGRRSQLRIAGVPVGREIPEHTVRNKDVGSIIVVVATDAPLIPDPIEAGSRRVSLGLGRGGSLRRRRLRRYFYRLLNREPRGRRIKGLRHLTMLPNERLNTIFLATVQATEEAMVNAMVAAEDDEGHQRSRGHRPAPRSPARGTEEIQPAGEVG